MCVVEGESVPEEERFLAREAGADSSLLAASSMLQLHVPGGVGAVGDGKAVTDAERVRWEAEKQNLYQQLDDKVCHPTRCYFFHSTFV